MSSVRVNLAAPQIWSYWLAMTKTRRLRERMNRRLRQRMVHIMRARERMNHRLRQRMFHIMRARLV
jgi:hypothetical protein